VLPPKLIHTLQGMARLPLSALGRLQVEEPILKRMDELLHLFREVQLAR